MDGIYAKIARAWHFIDELAGLVRALSEDPEFISGSITLLPDRRARPSIRVGPIPVAVPIVLGDAVHNLRSAVDHIAWLAVAASGNTPGPSTSFPVRLEDKGPVVVQVSGGSLARHSPVGGALPALRENPS